MVCEVCNGKGYVVEKHRESVCSECLGRGEYFFSDSERCPKQATMQICDLPYVLSSSHSHDSLRPIRS
jgi:DnaJ-class molecular chaperone